MSLKSQRDGQILPNSNPSKRVLIEQGIESRRAKVRSWGNQLLHVADADVYEIMENEKQRQFKGIELIASENFVCRAVMEALGRHLTNKYPEEMPGARYYVGNQYINRIEELCMKPALAVFNLDSEKWGVNIQPCSCTSANLADAGLLLPKDEILGLDAPSSGHLSHGYYIPSGKKVSSASRFFQSLSYKVNPYTGYIDYDKLEEKAFDFRPKILICSGSSYPREWDYSRFRQIADKYKAVLMCDLAHSSSLVAGKVKTMRKSIRCAITLNESAIFGDNGAICPGGVRIGSKIAARSCKNLLGAKNYIPGFPSLKVSEHLHPSLLLPTHNNSNREILKIFLLTSERRKQYPVLVLHMLAAGRGGLNTELCTQSSYSQPTFLCLAARAISAVLRSGPKFSLLIYSILFTNS